MELWWVVDYDIVVVRLACAFRFLGILFVPFLFFILKRSNFYLVRGQSFGFPASRQTLIYSLITYGDGDLQ